MYVYVRDNKGRGDLREGHNIPIYKNYSTISLIFSNYPYTNIIPIVNTRTEELPNRDHSHCSKKTETKESIRCAASARGPISLSTYSFPTILQLKRWDLRLKMLCASGIIYRDSQGILLKALIANFAFHWFQRFSFSDVLRVIVPCGFRCFLSLQMWDDAFTYYKSRLIKMYFKFFEFDCLIVYDFIIITIINTSSCWTWISPKVMSGLPRYWPKAVYGLYIFSKGCEPLMIDRKHALKVYNIP